MFHEKVFALSKGLFGNISVSETIHPEVRLMKINNEIEGQVFSSPDASFFSCLMDGPGGVAASRYLYGFIIPAWHFPDSKGLMLGLGAGIGATMLLALFPSLSLTAVEIDPEVIRLAREYFPLVAFYERQGRLTIIQAPANDYLKRSKERFSFALLDLFSGDEGNQHNLPLLNEILSISPYFMANIITSEPTYFETTKECIWLRTAQVMASEKSNWLMTNMKNISPVIHEYQLFDDSLKTNINVIAANNIFRYILSQIDAACFYRSSL